MYMQNEETVLTDKDGASLVRQIWNDNAYSGTFNFELAIVVLVKRTAEGDELLSATARAR